MTEVPDLASSDQNTGVPSTIHVPTAEIPERYVERLAKARTGRIGELLVVMGMTENEAGVQIPTAGIKERLEEHGLSPQFDLVPVDHVIDPPTYLKMIERGEAPLGDLFHDFVFHGVGFEVMDETLASTVKGAAQRARLTNNPDVMGRCVDMIDALTASYFGSDASDNQGLLAQDISDRVRELAKIYSVSVPGEDMIEGMRANQQAQTLIGTADEIGKASASWFNRVLELV